LTKSTVSQFEPWGSGQEMGNALMKLKKRSLRFDPVVIGAQEEESSPLSCVPRA